MLQKILLIAPTLNRTSWYTESTKYSPPLGLYRLKAWLEERVDYKVDVVDPNIDVIPDDTYDIIGISSVYTTMENDLKLGEKLKQKCRFLFFGGANPTLNPKPYERLGYVIKGEGEKPLLEFIESGDIRSPVPLSESDWQNAVMHIPFQHIPWKRYWEKNKQEFGLSEAIRIFTEIGCYRNCSFCSERQLWGKIKCLTAEQMRMLIERVSKILPESGVIMLQGSDEVLPGKVKKRWFRLYEEGWKSPRPLIIQTNVESLDEEVIEALRFVGVQEVDLGLESFSQPILEEFNKNVTAEENEKILELLLKEGIRVYGNMILRGEDTDERDVEHTLERIEYWRKRGVKFGVNEKVQKFL